MSDIPQVYNAIATVMGAIGRDGISKSRKNDQQGYKFRGIDDVYNALNGYLSLSGLCILPRVLSRQVTERTTAKGGVLFYAVLDVEFDLVCAVDGSKHTVRTIGEAMDSGDKATNKAMSAAYKYMAMEVFCIPTEADNDADATTHEVTPAARVIAGNKTPGREAFDALGDEGQRFITEYADVVTNIYDNKGDVMGYLAMNMLDSDEKTAMWSLLRSDIRGSIKKSAAETKPKEAA